MCHITAYTVAPPAGPWEQYSNFSKWECHKVLMHPLADSKNDFTGGCGQIMAYICKLFMHTFHYLTGQQISL